MSDTKKSKIYFMIDITWSMDRARDGLKKAIKNAKKMLALVGIDIAVITYGDYSTPGAELDYVVKLDPSFGNSKDRQNGGDNTEALNSALAYAIHNIPPKSCIIIITDACGATSEFCTSCNRDIAIRDREVAAICRTFKEYDKKDCYFENFFSLLASKHHVISIIKDKMCRPDGIYEAHRGLAFIENKNIISSDFVFEKVFEIVSQVCGGNIKDQKTSVLINISEKVFTPPEIKAFRTLVLENPSALEKMGFVAGCYYNGINFKDPAQANDHTEFFRKLQEGKISRKALDDFKAAQYPPKVLADLQKCDGFRISSTIQISDIKIIDLFAFWKGGDAYSQINEIAKSFRITGDKKEGDGGVPLSEIKKDMSLLLSYIGRQVFGSKCYYIEHQLYPIFVVAVSTWGIPQLQEIARAVINAPAFLNFDSYRDINPMFFNIGYLGFLRNGLLGKISSAKITFIEKLWKLCNFAKLLSVPVDITYEADIKKMSMSQLIAHGMSRVPVNLDMALGIHFPPNLFVRLKMGDEVNALIDNMTKWHIADDDTTAHIAKLTREYGCIFVSTYAKNFYRDFNIPDELDSNMTTDVVSSERKKRAINYEDFKAQYDMRIGDKGQNIFSSASYYDYIPGGPEAFICTDCGKAYVVHDTFTGISGKRKCAMCRKISRLPGDRYCADAWAYTVSCANGHETLSAHDFKSVIIPKDKCFACTVPVGKQTITTSVVFSTFVKENINFVSREVQIPVALINQLIKAENSACNAVNSGGTVFVKGDWVFPTEETKITYNTNKITKESWTKLSATIEEGFKMSCLFCANSLHMSKFVNICTNSACSAICVRCIETTYGDIKLATHTGKLLVSKVRCAQCTGVLVTRYAIGGKNFSLGLVKKLRKMGFEEKLRKGELLWKCSSGERCCDKGDGIFSYTKIACAGAEPTERFCEPCTAQKEREEKARMAVVDVDKGVDDLGFNIVQIDGKFEKERQCPHCATRQGRIDGCAHMTCCSCGEHFCWCCGNGFDSATDVYNHLTEIYGNYFPSDERIRKYIMTGSS